MVTTWGMVTVSLSASVGGLALGAGGVDVAVLVTGPASMSAWVTV